MFLPQTTLRNEQRSSDTQGKSLLIAVNICLGCVCDWTKHGRIERHFEKLRGKNFFCNPIPSSIPIEISPFKLTMHLKLVLSFKSNGAQKTTFPRLD